MIATKEREKMRITRAVFYDLLAPLHRDGAEYLNRFKDSEKTYPDEKQGLQIDDERLEQLIVSHREEMHGLRPGELYAQDCHWSKLPPIPERSLSIPIASGITGAWAPNGYGKTFALLLLQRMLRSRANSEGRHWLLRFCVDALELANGGPKICADDYLDIVDYLCGDDDGGESDSPLAAQYPAALPGVIPFRRLVFQFQDDNGKFTELIIAPVWEMWETKNIYGLRVNDVLTYDNDTRSLTDEIDEIDDEDDEELPVWCGGESVANGISVNQESAIMDLGNIKTLENTVFLYAEIPKKAGDGDCAARLSNCIMKRLMDDSRVKVWKELENERHHGGVGVDMFDASLRTWAFANEKRNIRAKYLNDNFFHDEWMNEYLDTFSNPIEYDDCFWEGISTDTLVNMRIIKKVVIGVEKIEDTISSTTMMLGKEPDAIKLSDPWGLEVEFGVVHEKGSYSDLAFKADGKYIKWDVLSFGQRTEIITQLVIAVHNLIGVDSEEYSQICTFIDEPEAGRSEYWLDLLGEQFKNLALSNDIDENRGLVIISHRSRLLRKVTPDSRYNLMQPIDKLEE